jgi:hypothetical protein
MVLEMYGLGDGMQVSLETETPSGNTLRLSITKIGLGNIHRRGLW